MPGVFSPKFSVLSDWRTTVAIAFQTLRRIKFVIEDTFSFGDFDPSFSVSGTGVTKTVHRARYIKIWKMMWISFDATFTIGVAPGITSASIRIPFNASVNGASSSQGGGVFILLETIPFTYEVGGWHVSYTEDDKIVMKRQAPNEFTTDPTRVSLNCFVETV